MHILFITLYDIDNLDSPGIYTDLLKEFRNNKHKVFVISPTERKHRQKTKLYEFDFGRLLKVKIGNVQKRNFIEKGLSTILLQYQILKSAKKFFSDIKFDLILYSTPPITFIRLIKYFKKRDQAVSYLLLKDIFPQNAIDLKLFSKNGIIYRYFRRLEKELYDISDYIGTMSPANSKFLIDNNNISPNKIEVCPNSIIPMDIEYKKNEKEKILNKYGIPLNKTLFIYGGNLGKPQGIDFLIQCILLNENNENSFFIIVGSGTEFQKLDRVFKMNKIINAVLISHLPKCDYEKLVMASDVGLIFLDYKFTIPNFPSRLLSYMQASKPVIAATDPVSDIGDIIEQGNFGAKVMSNDYNKFNSMINKFSEDTDLEKLGKNARNFLEKNYTSEISYNIIMNRLKENIDVT